MPGWHAAAKKWVADGKLKIIGVIQEQHPERCQLFAQWKQFDWPIVHDPINLLGNSAVPIAVAIDEHGIVRSRRPNPRTFEAEFLNQKFSPPETSAANKSMPLSIGVSSDWKSLVEKSKKESTTQSLKTAGDSVVLWGGNQQINSAIQLYQEARQLSPKDPTLLFRLGVAYQIRNESAFGLKNDFGQAVEYWKKALEANPNQYIWRRRIQQYGPRLDKPYPFYDWVQQARQEIKARGEVPIELPVEPVGAELASRSKSLKESTPQKNPDPKNQIVQDLESIVEIESVVVPHTSQSDRSSMVHVILTPKIGVQWSNEAGPLAVWVEGKDVRQSQKLFNVTNRKLLESNERRKIEFEIARQPGAKRLNGFALYYVCEKGGECRYLRQDFEIEFKDER